jgi:hypothetical protein
VINKGTNQKNLYLALMVSVILLATWLRLWQLAESPPGLWFDESYNALEAIGVLQTGQMQVFFAGNNGREPFFIYLLVVLIKFLGAQPYTIRFAAALGGIITIPLLFKLAICLFKSEPQRYWLAIIAAAGLSVSFWHVGISRIGLRAIWFPPFIILCLFLFCRALQTQRYRYFVGAGLVLGLSQYTYLAVRFLPLLFILLGLSNLFWSVWPKRLLWRGLGLMAITSVVVFLPLGGYFLLNPGTFLARAENISIADNHNSTMAGHLVASLRLFIDATGTRWRYTMLTRPLFDAVNIAGFWLGIPFLVIYLRKGAGLILGWGLLVSWLPGFLSQDPVHELRQLGVLPFFYIIMALGIFSTIAWSTRTFWNNKTLASKNLIVGLIAVLLVVAFSGAVTGYDYFVRWTNHPNTYEESRGELFDLALLAKTRSSTATVVLPFETYSYPAIRLMLHNYFKEEILDAPGLVQTINQNQQIILMGPINFWPPKKGLAWLTHNSAGEGIVYISNMLPRLPFEEASQAQTILNKRNQIIGYQQPLAASALTSMLAILESARPTSFEFAGALQLAGYHLTPAVIAPGSFSALDLYWRGVSTAELGGDVLLEVLDLNGKPVTQLHEPAFSSQVGRWRWQALIPGRHLIWTGSDLPSGIYILQLGWIDSHQRRLAITTSGNHSVNTQVPLGLLYVSGNGTDPRVPLTPLNMMLDNGLNILGYSVSSTKSAITLNLHWSTTQLLTEDYVTVAQLVDNAGLVATQVETLPLSGLYPTSAWKPGEIIVDPLVLPLPQHTVNQTPYKIIISIRDASTGQFAGLSDRPAQTQIQLDIQ